MQRHLAILICLLFAVSITTAAHSHSHKIPSCGFYTYKEADTLQFVISDSLDTDTLLLREYNALTTDSLTWDERIKTTLDGYIISSLQGNLADTQAGVVVYDLTADSLLYAFHPTERMRPASTMKLITAITALHDLGSGYSFHTDLLADGFVDSLHTLHGNIYLRGTLDPRFNHDDLLAFIRSIRELGIDSLGGTIVTDLSFKDTLRWGEGWCWDDNNPTLTPLLLSGKDTFLSQFIEELNQSSIRHNDSHLVAITPNGTQELCRRTHTIDQILGRMMKKSDNLYAEALFYQLAAHGGIRYASAEHAISRIKNLMRQWGETPDRYRLADGSGLSLYNYLSPHLLVRFLREAYTEADIYSHLRPSLPIAGVDGTLEKRMRRGHPAYQHVRAKTGTLESVSTLAGYAENPSGHLLAFAIMNQSIPKATLGRQFQDHICGILCK